MICDSVVLDTPWRAGARFLWWRECSLRCAPAVGPAQGWPLRAEPRAGLTPAACRLTFVTPCLRLFLYRWPYSCVGPTWGPVLGSSSACVLAIIASSPRILALIASRRCLYARRAQCWISCIAAHLPHRPLGSAHNGADSLWRARMLLSTYPRRVLRRGLTTGCRCSTCSILFAAFDRARVTEGQRSLYARVP